MTELTAVNQMLKSIREAPVASLTVATDLTPEAAMALNELRDLSRMIQSAGFDFNTDLNVILYRDSTSHQIDLGPDVVRIEIDPFLIDPTVNIVQRGTRLYDRKNSTYALPANIPTTAVVRYLPWDSIPEVAQQYIALHAARVFEARTVGSDKLLQHASIEEEAAKQLLMRTHLKTERVNLMDADGVRQIAYRGMPWVL